MPTPRKSIELLKLSGTYQQNKARYAHRLTHCSDDPTAGWSSSVASRGSREGSMDRIGADCTPWIVGTF